MADELQNYIELSRQQGLTDQQIKEALLQAGWLEEQLSSYFLKNPTLPQTPALVQSTPVTKSGLKILPWALGLLLLAAVGVSAYFIIGSRTRTNSLQQETTPELVSEAETAAPAQELVAFVSDLKQVSFYDLQSGQFLPQAPEFLLNNGLTTLGPWSPTGDILPIHVQDFDSSQATLFYFDVRDQSVTTMLTSQDYEDLANIRSDFSYSSGWDGNGDLVLEPVRNIEQQAQDLTILSDPHFISVAFEPLSLKQVANGLRVTRSFESLLRDVTELTIDDNPSSVRTTDMILGRSGNNIITLVVPQAEGWFSQDEEQMAELEMAMAELESQNLSEEEMRVAVMGMLQPTGESSLQTIDATTAQVTKTISITDDKWYSQYGVVHPTKPEVILYQTDGYYGITNERYISVNIETGVSDTLIAQRPVTDDTNEKIFYRHASKGGSFQLSQSGNWLVMYASVAETSETQIKAFNINTREEKTICSSQCYEFDTFSPVEFSTYY